MTYKELGCNAIEIGLLDFEDEERWQRMRDLDPRDFEGFEHISLHAPARNFVYGDNHATTQALDYIQELYDRIRFKHAIVHPDRVEDWGVFGDYSFPLATENMDDHKQMARNVRGLNELFSKIDLPLVLDLNHCYVNDGTLQLAADIYSAFKDRIVQLHLSGFKTLHDPLHETGQLEIIKAVPDKNLPIIIEGYLPTAEGIRAEYEYVTSNLLTVA